MRYFIHPFVFFLLFFAPSFAWSVCVHSVLLPNIKVADAFYVSYYDKSAVNLIWQKACIAVGLSVCPPEDGNYCLNKARNAVYPQPGDICADGSFRVPGWGQHCDDEQPRCANSDAVLSDDGTECCSENRRCEPDLNLVSEEKLLAAIVYGEASVKNQFEEMAAIASAVVRTRDKRGLHSIQELVKKSPHYSKVIENGNTRYHNAICDSAEDPYALAYLAARQALAGGVDYSEGACFWDGVDLKTQGASHYRYKQGFKFTDPKHNIFDVDEPLPHEPKGEKDQYDSIYESTATFGQTVFWKYTESFMKTQGVKQCA